MLILHNAKIYTLNPIQPQAAALVVDGQPAPVGRIIACGDAEEIIESYGHLAKQVDLGGRVVLPGMVDSHLHFKQYALSLQYLALHNLSKAEILQAVKEKAQNSPPGEWVRGHGWSQANWDNQFPTARELDEAAPDHPVLLTAASLHSSWVNSAALQLAGITANTPDPANGRFGRLEDGSPDGMLYEEATPLVMKAVPEPTIAEVMTAMRGAQQVLWEMGLTGLHDFDRIDSFVALQALKQEGALNLRVLKNLPVEKLDAIIKSGLRSGLGDDLLWIGGIKVFADGALGQRTAAMFQPYEGEADNYGMLFMDNEELFEQASKAALGGLSMTVHAIGDKANHEVLLAYQQLRRFERAQNLPHRRHRIEHVQIIHPDDLGKLAELDLIASIQPIHATADIKIADAYWGERAVTSYAWNSLLAHGTHLSFGSDAPVDSPNPF